ncbi:DUF2789 family protein [Enterovibrio nigricans]|uniref:DUF2789 domain-containing protein n=1 Tax=Enterovibrio nigricans DSM 22720 TaxID=1121868 RepID=A0A1T4UBZ3_9GAMM|nr:DUF2789 family protein [Enterovibrio nigricans]PKF51484.1 DUF2789 domain-containing protein [Enterovibrio nigricans]SKA50179.1 Protein of unknown function [Enterovibrio nigricans DSM 22720]
MEVFNHNLESLFQQLGLPSEKASIEAFVIQHSLKEGESLTSATFWTTSQKQFLEEAKLQDADWVEQIDLLDTLLRKP